MLQALAMVVGVGPLTVHEILTRLWKYLNQHDLTDGQMIQCDTGSLSALLTSCHKAPSPTSPRQLTGVSYLILSFAAAFASCHKVNDFIQICLNERRNEWLRERMTSACGVQSLQRCSQSNSMWRTCRGRSPGVSGRSLEYPADSGGWQTSSSYSVSGCASSY